MLHKRFMIRGIDSQIMINKSVDYAKQMSDQINNVQQGKDFVAEMEKARIKREDESVLRTEEAKDERVHREKDRREDGFEQSASSQSEAREGALTQEDVLAEEKAEGLGVSVDINV